MNAKKAHEWIGFFESDGVKVKPKGAEGCQAQTRSQHPIFTYETERRPPGGKIRAIAARPGIVSGIAQNRLTASQ